MAASNGRKTSSSNRKNKKSTAAKTAGRRRRNSAAAQESALFHEIGLIVLFAAMVFFFCCNLGLTGPVGDAVSGVLFGVFGLTAYVLPVLLFLAVAFWFANTGNPSAVRKLCAGIVLFLMAGIVCDLIAEGAAGMAEYSAAKLYESSREMKGGGGVLGGSISYFLQGYLETIGTVLVVLLCTVVSLILLTEKSLLDSVKRGGSRVRELSREDTERRKEMAELRRLDQEERSQRRREMAQERRMEQEETRTRRREEERSRRQAQEEQREQKATQRRLKAEEKENEKILHMDRRQRGVSLDKALLRPDTARRNDMHEIILAEEELEPVPAQEKDKQETAISGVRTENAGAGTIHIHGVKKEGPESRAEDELPAGQEMSVKAAESLEERTPEIRIHRAQPGIYRTESDEAAMPGPEPVDRKKDSGDQAEYTARLRAMQRKASEPVPDAVQPEYGTYAEEQNIYLSAEHTEDRESAEEENAQETSAYENSAYIQETEEMLWDDRDTEPDGKNTGFDRQKSHREDAGMQAGQRNPQTPEYGYEAETVREPGLKQEQKNETESRSGSGIQPVAGSAVQATTAQRAVPDTGPAAVLPGNTPASVQGNRIQPEIVAPKKYMFPPISLLQKGVAAAGDSERELRETAMHLQQTLSTFGVKVTITDISQGPSVTRYELQPEQGVKVSKIVGLTDDIKLNLAAMDIRIEAPIPGKAAIGIEVPNKETIPVGLRELLESKEFSEFQSNLAFAVGKDIAGKVVVSDIAKMPHMLIAGATGSGKSVCINTLIMSILYKAHPDDVKLIMVDPKVVELSIYNGIPHLLIPVVTDPKKASAALNWGVSEMDDRYRRFAEYGARNLKEYNRKVEAQQRKGDTGAPKKLPQIVIIVDELADLMMVCPGEVEASICRLAQLARACGIHLVIATQRPSVDVITGLIKANMPSRVAFSVSSGVDSRTILDMVGAEKLLGKGDMLFYPQGYPKPARVQGAFVSDQEVSDVVDFLKNQALGNTYEAEIEEKIANIGSGTGGESEKASGGSSVDELFEKAGRLIIDKDKASIGMLQRALQIGFNRAARIMDQLCQYGVVGEEEGTKPRKILMSPEQFEQLLEEVA
ncbi:MAG TPA: DNA translocase FtsK [Lachnospiraceae bacterium]|nr:DNA translocase FtsK [Lachnospiraceae bacterium]